MFLFRLRYLIMLRLDKGEVYVSDMFDLYKYENLLYTMNLTGQGNQRLS